MSLRWASCEVPPLLIPGSEIIETFPLLTYAVSDHEFRSSTKCKVQLTVIYYQDKFHEHPVDQVQIDGN